MCAVKRRRFSAGAIPARQQSLQPVAIGAVEEVTNPLKHFSGNSLLSRPLGRQADGMAADGMAAPRLQHDCKWWIDPIARFAGLAFMDAR